MDPKGVRVEWQGQVLHGSMFNNIRIEPVEDAETRRARVVGEVLESLACGDFDDDESEIADRRLRACGMLLDYGYCGVDTDEDE